MSTVKKVLVFLGVFGLITLVAMASAFGWGASHPLQEKQQAQRDVDDDHHHRTIYHGGHFRPFYGSYGRGGGRGGTGGIGGGK